MAGPGTISSSRFQFGVYTVDLRAGEITKYGTRIRLQDHPFQILISLLGRPGEVVTREELRRQLWPDGTFVDFDHGISSAVNKLRTALGDTAANPKFIETVGRRGYRFIYPLTDLPPEVELAALNPTVAQAPPPRRSRRVVIVLGIVALVAVIGAAVTVLYRMRPAAERIRSVAVLPLKNLSSSTDEDFFSEGLTDELTAQLATLPGLRVIPGSSVLRYKNGQTPLPAIGRELHVDAVVEGSVLRFGDKVRINVQLIDTDSQRYVWAASYEREQRNIIDLQNEVTRRIADSIKLSLDPEERDRLNTARAIDPRAHDDYLRGRSFWRGRTMDDLLMSVKYFQRATDRDPEYAPAYAGLTDSYVLLAAYSLNPPQADIEKARTAALKSLELDNRLAEAHTSLALIYENYDWNWSEAEKEYRHAIALNPSYATAHHWYAEFLSGMGRFQESEVEYARARQLDPFSLIIQTDHAVSLFYARQYDASLREFLAVQSIDPNFPRAHIIANVYAQQGRYDEAIADISNKLPQENLWVLSGLATLYTQSGNKKSGLHYLHALEREYRGKTLNPSPLVAPYIALGYNDKALAALQKAYEEHCPAIVWLKVDPTYDPLRADPRFHALLQRVGLGQ